MNKVKPILKDFSKRTENVIVIGCNKCLKDVKSAKYIARENVFSVK